MATKLEDKFKWMCITGEKPYYETYLAVKWRLEKSYFPFIRDFQPFYTDHGITHVNRVLEKIYGFLYPHLPVGGAGRDLIFDKENLYILMNAVLWHDVGNIYGRNGHQNNINNIFSEIKSFLYDDLHRELIIKIAQGHCGIGSIERNIYESSVMIGENTIYPRFLSALLRISDELDEDCHRVEERIYPRIPLENKRYWKFCLFNKTVYPKYIIDSFGNTSLKIQINSKMKREELGEMFQKNGVGVMAIKEYISRINKLNDERIYCNQYLHAESVFYFRKIDAIEIKLTICDRDDRLLDEVSYEFDDDCNEDNFYANQGIIQILNRYLVEAI